MKPYSQDLRTRIVRAIQEGGLSKSAAARLFDVSLSSVKRYARITDRGASLEPRKGGGRPPKVDETDHRKAPRSGRREAPGGHRPPKAALSGATDRQKPRRLHHKASPEAAGLQSKKRTVGALERDEWLRAAWKVMVVHKTDPKRLMFVDEMGTDTSLSPLRAWSRRGERARCTTPRNRGKNTTLLSSMSAEGMGPSLAITGAIDAEVFEAYLERVLLPELRPGRVVVMDNLSAHKTQKVRELVEGAGCELLYLPPYSPDLNPIEEAFSKIKNLLRKAEARTREALVEAMGQAISSVTDEDARGFFSHCGYGTPVQSL